DLAASRGCEVAGLRSGGRASLPGMMPRMHSIATGAAAMPTTTADAPRRTRVRALTADLALCAAVQIAFATAAVLLWLVQTEGGARDLSSRSATVGWAIVLAAVPGWLGMLAQSSAARGGTPGQRWSNLTVLGTPSRRLLRLAVHPVGAIGWGWL